MLFRSELNADMIVCDYFTTMDVDHLYDAIGAVLGGEDADAIVGCFDRIEDINGHHFDDSDIPMLSADLWAGMLIQESRHEIVETLSDRLYIRNIVYRDNLSAVHYDRFFLALSTQ